MCEKEKDVGATATNHNDISLHMRVSFISGDSR